MAKIKTVAIIADNGVELECSIFAHSGEWYTRFTRDGSHRAVKATDGVHSSLHEAEVWARVMLESLILDEEPDE